MKTFIASDFHGKDPTGLVRTLYENGEIDRVRALGDYDEPSILRNILKLGIDKLALVGNHEYELSRGSDKVGIGDSITSGRYKRYWGDTDAGDFARNGPIRAEEEISGKKVVYVHGSLVDFLNFETPGEIWGYLHDFHGQGFTHERRVECNFNEMKKAGYWIMFRGHDHKQEVYSTKKEDYLGHYHQVRKAFSDVILEEGDMNIVTVGPFERGDYCIFDDSNFKLEFKNWKK